MTKDLSPEDRAKLDAVLLSRPGLLSEDGGPAPPPWWKGEEEAAQLAAAALGIRPSTGRR